MIVLKFIFVTTVQKDHLSFYINKEISKEEVKIYYIGRNAFNQCIYFLATDIYST